MSQPRNQWKRTRHTQRATHKASKRRANQQAEQHAFFVWLVHNPKIEHPRTTAREFERRARQPGMQSYLDWLSAGREYDVQPVRTRQRQKKAA